MDRRTCLHLLGAGVSGLARCSALGVDTETLDEPVDVRLRNQDDTVHTLEFHLSQLGPNSGKGDPGYGTLYRKSIQLLAGAELTLSDVITKYRPVRSYVKIDPETSDREFADFFHNPEVATGTLNVEITSATDLEQYFTISGAGSFPTGSTPTPTKDGKKCAGPKRTGTVAFEVRMKNASETAHEGQLRVGHTFCRCRVSRPNCVEYQRSSFMGQYRLEPGETKTRTVHRASTRRPDWYEVEFAVLENEEPGGRDPSAVSRDKRYGIDKTAAERFDQSTHTESVESPFPRQKDFHVQHGSTTTFSATILDDSQDGARLEVEPE